MTSEFTKRWDKLRGFNEVEANLRKEKINAAHGVGRPDSKWNPAEIVEDPDKKLGGYKIVISTKDSPK